MAIALTVFSCSQSFCLGFSFILSPCSPRPQVLDWKRKALVCRCVALENALLGLDDEVASLAYSLFHRGETNVLSRADNCATVMKKVYAHDNKSPESSLRRKKSVLLR